MIQQELLQSHWTRIRLKALDKTVVFNNLLTHINIMTLREAFKALDGNKALGIDRISKSSYGEKLEENFEDLVSRIHLGTYKPQPKREVLIPKANGESISPNFSIQSHIER